MFTRPAHVSDADIVRGLAEGWSIDVTGVEYAAVGFGSYHWRATTAAGDWFVTVDDLVTKRRRPDESLQTAGDRLVAALATARELSDAGFELAVGAAQCARRVPAVGADRDLRDPATR